MVGFGCVAGVVGHCPSHRPRRPVISLTKIAFKATWVHRRGTGPCQDGSVVLTPPNWVTPRPWGLSSRGTVLIVLQFPVSDARSFRAACQDRLDVPHWPKPVTEIRPEFMHFFGRAVERRRGADSAWTDEMSFCLARRAIRFDDLAVRRVGPSHLGFRPAAAFRRLLSDGRSVARLEVGLTHNDRIGRLNIMTEASVLQVASEICQLPTRVPVPGTTEWRALLRQGKAVAELYTRATSKLASASSVASAACHDLVCPGRPLLLIELSGGEGAGLSDPFMPGSFVPINPMKARGAKISFGRLSTTAGVVAAWVIQRGVADRLDLRSLRLCLMRLHAEQESLDIVLQHVQAKRLPDESAIDRTTDLLDHLDRATRLIKRDSWGGVSQSAILEAYDAADEVTPKAGKSNLLERFEGSRVQVLRKLDDYSVRRAAIRVVPVTYVGKGGTYVEKNVTTNVSGQGNIVNIAEYMSNVTNTVAQNLSRSSVSPEVQELIKTLTKQIEDLATKIEPAATQQMGSDVETLSKEISSPRPRRKWYEVSLEGLKEAAEAVGDLGKPIIQTLKALAPLLLS